MFRRIAKALQYVKTVDENQIRLVKSATTDEKTAQLILQIKECPELLGLVSIFHKELAKIGINNELDPTKRNNLLWRYRTNYLWKYNRIHNVFWETCQLQNISQHDHTLGFSPDKIGILDPYNFSKDQYRQLQQGKFGDTDFTQVEIIGSPFKQQKSI